MSEPPDSDKSWKVKKKLRLLFLWTIANGWLKRRGRSKEGKNKIRKEVKMKQQQTIVKNQCFEECLYETWIEICVKKRGFRCFIQPNRKQSGFIFFYSLPLPFFIFHFFSFVFPFLQQHSMKSHPAKHWWWGYTIIKVYDRRRLDSFLHGRFTRWSLTNSLQAAPTFGRSRAPRRFLHLLVSPYWWWRVQPSFYNGSQQEKKIVFIYLYIYICIYIYKWRWYKKQNLLVRLSFAFPVNR